MKRYNSIENDEDSDDRDGIPIDRLLLELRLRKLGSVGHFLLCLFSRHACIYTVFCFNIALFKHTNKPNQAYLLYLTRK